MKVQRGKKKYPKRVPIEPEKHRDEEDAEEAEFDLADLVGIHPVTGKLVRIEMTQLLEKSHDVKAELRLMPKRFAFVLQVLEMSRDRLRLAQHEEYCAEEDLYIEVRATLENGADDKKKPTETDIKNRVKAHPKMRQAFRDRMEAERLYKHAEGAVRALEEKKKDLHMYVRYRCSEMSVMSGTEED